VLSRGVDPTSARRTGPAKSRRRAPSRQPPSCRPGP
jgi:hypothetical protein